MGGEAGAAAAVGSEGRVKSLGLVFEDERKGCYSSGETVAGHVLLEAAEPVALRSLRLEAHGRATAAWGPSPGAAAPAAASEVEYLNVRLSLREPPAGERGPGRAGPGRARRRDARRLRGRGRGLRSGAAGARPGGRGGRVTVPAPSPWRAPGPCPASRDLPGPPREGTVAKGTCDERSET